MSQTPTTDLSEFRRRGRAIHEARLKARSLYLDYAEQEREERREQRKTYALVLARERTNGESVAIAEGLARAAAADHEAGAAKFAALAKAQLLLIDQHVDSLVNLRREFDASQRIDGVAA